MKRFFTLFCLLIAGATLSFGQADAKKLAKRSFNKGNCRYKQFDYLRAVPHLKNAVNLNPNSALYSYTLGKALFFSWKERESLPHFERAFYLDSNLDPDLEYYLARALHMNGEFEKAIPHYENYRGRAEDPEDPMVMECSLGIQQCRTGIALMADPSHFRLKNMGEFVNSIWPEYAPTFSENYSYMLFTTRRPARNQDTKGSKYLPEDVAEEVFSARYDDETWNQAQIFSKPVHVFRHDASVTMADDGNTLIYYQSRHYGDLYVSHKQDGKWSKRQSLGANINTKKHTEPSVCFSGNGEMMYWVSNKPGGNGGRDIYRSTKNPDGTWCEGVNLGDNFNSPFDEDAPFITENGKTIYFASNGPRSMGGYDIFRSDLQPDGSWGNPVNLGHPINSPGDDIFFVPREGGSGFFLSSDRPGGFGDMDIYSGTDADDIDVTPMTVLTGKVTDKETNEPVDANLVITDPLHPEWSKTATVTRNSNSFNFSLPPRAREFNLEVKVKTPAGHLTTNNYVAGNLLDEATNRPLGGTVKLIDPATGRTLSEVATDPSNGYFLMGIPGNAPYKLDASSNGYQPHSENVPTEMADASSLRNKQIKLVKSNEEDHFVLKHQYFDPTKWDLKPQATNELGEVVRILQKNTAYRLKIIGHTDADSDEAYNMDLSRKRANAIADYLVSKGITRDRLEVWGKGESEPLNDNSTPMMKSLNRRVELFIVR